MLPVHPPATDRCSNTHLFRLTAVQSLQCTSLCVAAAKSAGRPHHGRRLPPLSRPRPQSFCRVTVDASICYSYCINNITLRIRKCHQQIKTSQSCVCVTVVRGQGYGMPAVCVCVLQWCVVKAMECPQSVWMAMMCLRSTML